MLSSRALVGAIAVLLVMAVHPQVARGAACVVACKDVVAACASTDCQGLTKRPLRRCKRNCKKSIVQDCFADLTICGATSARPPKPSSGGGGGGGGGGGSMGGW
jgi:hypothetical protein